MSRMKLSAAITATTLLVLLCGSAVRAGIVNGDFGATTLTNGGKAVYSDKDAGWFAKNAYDGIAPDNWRIQPAGYMEMLSNSGTKTRYGQVFSAGDMTGTGWSLEFDLGGSFTNVEAVQVWAGLEVASPSDGSTVINLNADGGPDNAIVQGSWVTLVNKLALTAGSHAYALAGDPDMSNYDIMAIRFRARNAGVGAQYDDVQFVLPVSGFTFDGETDQTWGIGDNWSGNVLPTTTDDPIIHEIGTTAAGRLVTLKVSGLSPTVSSLQVYHTGANTQQLTIGGDNDNTWNTLTLSDDSGGSGDLILGDASSTGSATVRVDREGHLIVEGDIVSANDANHTILLRYVENRFTLYGDIGTAASTNTIDLDFVRVANLDLFAGTNQSINADDFWFNANVDGSLGGGRTITVGSGDSLVSTGDALIGKNTKPQTSGNRTTTAYLVVEDGGTAEFNTLTLGAVRGANGGTGILKGIGGITVDGTFTANGLLTMATTDDFTPATAQSTLTVNAGSVVTLDGGVTTCTGTNTYTRSATITINDGLVTLGGDLTLGVGTNTTNAITLVGGEIDFGGNSVVLSSDGSAGTGSQTFDWSGGTLADVANFGTSLTQGDDTGTLATLRIGGSVGSMTIAGDYDLLSDGVVEIEIEGIGGPGVAGGHDQIVLTGDATLDGEIRLILDGYTPVLDDEFMYLDATGGILGSPTFDISAAVLGEGLSWDTSLLGTAAVVSTSASVPEPATATLFALGLLGLCLLGRRRK